MQNRAPNEGSARGSLQAVGVRKSIGARGSLQAYAVSKGLRARLVAELLALLATCRAYPMRSAPIAPRLPYPA